MLVVDLSNKGGRRGREYDKKKGRRREEGKKMKEMKKKKQGERRMVKRGMEKIRQLE
tara:strand:- start:245 stop:415 length:171 start_codon:yes stop_codon:yes gene_type:complete